MTDFISGDVPDLPIKDYDSNFFKRLPATIKEVLFSSKKFFEDRVSYFHSSHGLANALAFAVLVDWFGNIFEFIWRSLMGIYLGQHFSDLFNFASDFLSIDSDAGSLLSMRQSFYQFIFGVGSVLLSPLLTLIKLFIISFLVTLALRFFISSQNEFKVSRNTTLKVLCYSLAPKLYLIIPGFGIILASIFSFIIAIRGLKEIYKTSTSVSVFALIFPYLLGVVLLFSLIFVLVTLVISLIAVFL
jgi:hypothetical protein